MYSFLLIILEELIKLLAAVCTFILARWIYGLSTPEKDYRMVMSWKLFNLPLKFYRGIEAYHQLRGALLLMQL